MIELNIPVAKLLLSETNIKRKRLTKAEITLSNKHDNKAIFMAAPCIFWLT